MAGPSTMVDKSRLIPDSVRRTALHDDGVCRKAASCRCGHDQVNAAPFLQKSHRTWSHCTCPRPYCRLTSFVIDNVPYPSQTEERTMPSPSNPIPIALEKHDVFVMDKFLGGHSCVPYPVDPPGNASLIIIASSHTENRSSCV